MLRANKSLSCSLWVWDAGGRGFLSFICAKLTLCSKVWILAWEVPQIQFPRDQTT